MHAQKSKPRDVTPQAFLAGGCGTLWILASAHFLDFWSSTFGVAGAALSTQ